MAGHIRRWYAVKVEALATRRHRVKQLIRLGRRQHKDRVWWWLFQCLEERVERVLGKPVRFVNDVDLVLELRRSVLDLLPQISHVFDSPV